MHRSISVAPAMIVALAVPVVFTSAVTAQVQILTRVSSVYSSHNEPSTPISGPTWNESATDNQLGLTTVSTPHASFTSNVSNAGVTANIGGGGSSGPFQSGVSSSYGNGLDVTFQVTGSPVTVQIGLNGQSFPAGNAILRISNPTDTVYYFNSDTVATNTGTFPVSQAWNHVEWSGVLNPGTYHLYAHGGGATFSAGGGSGSSGSGGFDVNLVFVPAPGAAGLLGLAAVPFRRRRR